MTRDDAIAIFGSVRAMAAALSITKQAIYQWPHDLPQDQADRVTGAAVRLSKLPSRACPDEKRGAA